MIWFRIVHSLKQLNLLIHLVATDLDLEPVILYNLLFARHNLLDIPATIEEATGEKICMRMRKIDRQSATKGSYKPGISS